MKGFLYLISFLAVLTHFTNGYKIVALHNDAEDQEHSLKVFFSTKIVSITETVTKTVLKTDYKTCYNAEAGIIGCEQKLREDESIELKPKVEINGKSTPWEEVISPSRVSLFFTFSLDWNSFR